MSYQYILPMFYHEVAKNYVLEIYNDLQHIIPYCCLINNLDGSIISNNNVNIHQLHLNMIETRKILHSHQNMKMNDHVAALFMSTGAFHNNLLCQGWMFNSLNKIASQYKNSKNDFIPVAIKNNNILLMNTKTGDLYIEVSGNQQPILFKQLGLV